MKKLSEIYRINENLQLADKVYFKSGKLAPKVREIIVGKITNGDAWTKLVSDMYYSMAQQNKRQGEWIQDTLHTFEGKDDKVYDVSDYILQLDDWKELKVFYSDLKGYNKNKFPIKGFNINGVKEVGYFMSALKQRRSIIEELGKLPSVALRNMKADIRVERDYPELQHYRSRVEYFLAHVSYLSNRSDKLKEVILKKMYKSNITIEELVDFVEEKENLLGGDNFNKDEIFDLIKNGDSQELELIYKKGNILVVAVHGANGIKEIGCNSLWCFTYTDQWQSNWNKYSYNDMVYIIIDFSEESNSQDFMNVLIEPLDYYSKVEDGEDDEENTNKLFNMANDENYNPLAAIKYLIGLDKARKILTFGEEPVTPPKPKKVKEKDPNQLELSFESKLAKLYKEMISEDLTYSYTTTTGEEDDEYEIGKIVEDIEMPPMRMAKNIDISNEERSKISNINHNDLRISQGEYDGKMVNMIINLPWESNVNNGGIITDIQVIDVDGTNLYQIHIELSESIRGLGLGYKVYAALVQDLGHLYSGKGRQMNTSEVPKIWNKLKQDGSFECYENENGIICMMKGNVDKEALLEATGNGNTDLGMTNDHYNDNYDGYSY